MLISDTKECAVTKSSDAHQSSENGIKIHLSSLKDNSCSQTYVLVNINMVLDAISLTWG